MKYTQKLFTALFVGCLLSGAAVAQRRSNDLAQARATFRAADADDDGEISPTEARSAKVRPNLFAKFDDNQDRVLSQDEFTLLYRELVVKINPKVPADLEAEAVRIQAVRRARKSEAERVKREESTGGLGTAGTAERLRDAQRSLRSNEAAGVPTSTAGKLRRAKEVLAQRTTEGPASGRKSAVAEAQPVAEAPEIAAPVTGTPDPMPVSAATQLERASAILTRLVSENKLTPAEARDFYVLMEDRARNATGSPEASEAQDMGAMLKRAQNQLQRQVQAGGLSADEARQLNALMIERARNAAGNAPGASALAEAPDETEAPASAETANPDRLREEAGTQLERSKSLLTRLVREGRMTPDEARDFQGLLQDRARAAATGASQGQDVAAMLQRAQNQLQRQVQAGSLTADEARGLNAALVERARNIGAEDEAPAAPEASTAAADPNPSEPEAQLERSKQTLARLVDEGKLKPEEAREFFAALEGGVPSTDVGGRAAQPEEARALLTRAQELLQLQLEAGNVTGDEARSLNAALVDRAKSASERPAAVVPDGQADVEAKKRALEAMQAERAKAEAAKTGAMKKPDPGQEPDPTKKDDAKKDSKPVVTGDARREAARDGERKPLEDPKPATEKAKPVTDKPVTDKPVVDKPVVDKPVVDKPVVDKPVVDKPVVDKPVVDKPVVDKPIDEGRTRGNDGR